MQFKLTAYITKSGRVISTGSNKAAHFNGFYKKGTKELWLVNTCAEKDAIQKALKLQDGSKHLLGATIYVQRFNKYGETKIAKPCKHCQELIESVGIKKVIYTDSNGYQTMRIK